MELSAINIFFALGYTGMYMTAAIILKPFRKHYKRYLSTLSLKISYLVFFAVFLLFTYLLLFGDRVLEEGVEQYDTLFNIHFLFFLSSAIIPNAGVILRKQVRKKRVVYNIFFTGINVIYGAYLFWATTSGVWMLL